jgi:hypothetical protein
MQKPTSITDDLRGQLAALEGRTVELLSERDEISYNAFVDREPKAIKKLEAINGELNNIANQVASLESALKEATKREQAADDADRAKRRKADAEQAGVAMAEAERLAELMDGAMRDLQKHAVDFQQKMADVRRLSGSGPQHDGMRALLSRAIKSGLMALPQYADVLQPHERSSVAEIAAAWATQVRNRISTIIETAAKAA